MAGTLGIVGTGLIGGSMAVDLKRRGFVSSVLGVEKDPIAAEAAKTTGLVDEICSLEDCFSRADIIVIAVPALSAIDIAVRALDFIGDSGKIVIDVCSTKEAICRAVSGHPARKRFVATHPMAGTEYSGPWAAQPGLFDGRACIIANADESAPDALQTVESLYGVLNMRLLYMDAPQHDMHAAYVSHISHITSFALALTVLDKEKDEKHIFDLASGGFSSTVRLAKSSSDMWVPILSQNRDNVLQVVDTYIEKMQEFRDAVDRGDKEHIKELIEQANRIKRILR